MSTFHSGKYGTATINSIEVPTISWAVNPSCVFVEFRNSKTGSFPLREATFNDADVTISLDVDFDQYPFSSPITIIPGNMAQAKLYLRQTAQQALNGDFWQFPKSGANTTTNGLLIVRNPFSMDIEGKLATSFEGSISGAYTYPTGISPPT